MSDSAAALQTAASAPETAASQPAILGDPPFGIVYGDPGTGKTLDAVLTWPNAYVLCLPGSLAGCRGILGDALYADLLTRTLACADLESAAAFVEAIAAGQYPARPVILDDVTVQSDTTLGRLDTMFSARNAFQKWGAYDAIIQRVRGASRSARVPVVMTGHVRHASTDEFGATVKGGAEVGGKRAKGRLEAVVDYAYGVATDSEQWPHPGRYVCKTDDARMVYKDRFRALVGTGPMNLRELFRAKGVAVGPRPAGLEWLDDFAEAVVSRAQASGSVRAAAVEVFTALTGQGVHRGHAYWAIRDGVARAEIQATGDFFDQVMTLEAPRDASAGAAMSTLLGAG